MRRIFLVAAVVLALGASEAQAMNHAELNAARVAVRDYLAPTLELPGREARKRLFDCGRHSCRFWVRGTARCRGVVRVRETASQYVVWFKPLRCG